MPTSTIDWTSGSSRPSRTAIACRFLVEILGTGCAKCHALEQAARDAVERTGIEAEIVKVDQIDEIVRRGVMLTPALAIDGVVKSSGRVLSAAEIQGLLA